MSNEKRILAEKRRVELRCLGIDPHLFLVATKWINKHYSYVLYEDKGLIWTVDEYGKTDKCVSRTDIKDEIRDVLGIDSKMCTKIVNEWERDRVLYHRMTEDISLHWKYLFVPLLYGEDDEEYHF